MVRTPPKKAARSASAPALSNVSVEHVAPAVLTALHEIAEDKDAVSSGPVRLYLTAGRDTVLAWPSTAEEKDRARKGREVDWFRGEIDRSQWAIDLTKAIEALKARPKNAVNDREIQTLRQRLSYAATVLRRTRDMASKIVTAEQCGFSVTLPDMEGLTRTVYPITVIDEAKKGLPIQLGVRDFLNLECKPKKLATALHIKGSRKNRKEKGAGMAEKAITSTGEILDEITEKPERLSRFLGVLARYMRDHTIPKSALVKHEAVNLGYVLAEYCSLAPAANSFAKAGAETSGDANRVAA